MTTFEASGRVDYFAGKSDYFPPVFDYLAGKSDYFPPVFDYLASAYIVYILLIIL